MNLDHALRLVEAARAEADALGVAACIVIVDAGGHSVALGRMDGTAFMTVDIAAAKAWTSAATGVATSILASAMVGETYFAVGAAAATDGKFIMVGGGAPITADGAVIGGLGVSGGTADQDAAIAEAAATAS